MKSKMQETSDERLEALPVARILQRRSGHVMGWRYRWNTGEYEDLWICEIDPDAEYEPISKVSSGSIGPE